MSFKDARRDFPVLARYAYLNTGTFGPLLQRSLDALTEVAQMEITEGRCQPSYYEKLTDLRDSVRGSLARLIGAQAHEVALTSSTTNGCHVVMGDWRSGPVTKLLLPTLNTTRLLPSSNQRCHGAYCSYPRCRGG